jgi:ectoine hydroxylase-related dioxygenase (phytanoyl-CoA dioxygenase family)
MNNFSHEIESNGFTTIDPYLNLDSVDLLIKAIDDLNLSPGRAGIRNLLELSPYIRKLAQGQEICSLVEPILGDKVRVVRGIFFDKQPTANWKVPWHQYVTIAVKNRLDVAGYHPWSIKAGIHHVQPPTAILEQMLTVRIHLDRTDESNGALKVIPGSHAYGKLADVEIDSPSETLREQWKQLSSGISCNLEPGGVLLMRPLLLHASSMATIPSHRRVIHLEYASHSLPSGLEWYSDAMVR